VGVALLSFGLSCMAAGLLLASTALRRNSTREAIDVGAILLVIGVLTGSGLLLVFSGVHLMRAPKGASPGD